MTKPIVPSFPSSLCRSVPPSPSPFFPLSLCILCLFVSLFLFFLPSPVHAAPTTWKSTRQIKPPQYIEDLAHTGQISAVVGHGIITIEGYTSSQAKVNLTSSQNNLGHRTTRAKQNGFFRFTQVILPAHPGELWLQATDRQGLTTTPVSLPEPPQSVTKIEGIILPPSVAQSHQTFTKKINGYSYGTTIPRAKVTIYLSENQTANLNFTNRLKRLLQNVLGGAKRVFAQEEVSYPLSGRKQSVTANAKGYFNFPLSENQTGSYRYFVTTRFNQNYSPKSSNLTFRIQSPWQKFCQQLLLIANKLGKLCLCLLKNLLFWITIEIITLFALIRHLKKQNKLKTQIPKSKTQN